LKKWRPCLLMFVSGMVTQAHPFSQPWHHCGPAVRGSSLHRYLVRLYRSTFGLPKSWLALNCRWMLGLLSRGSYVTLLPICSAVGFCQATLFSEFRVSGFCWVGFMALQLSGSLRRCRFAQLGSLSLFQYASQFGAQLGPCIGPALGPQWAPYWACNGPIVGPTPCPHWARIGLHNRFTTGPHWAHRGSHHGPLRGVYFKHKRVSNTDPAEYQLSGIQRFQS
jgi:hypothetical protein